MLSRDFAWSAHINSVISKASQRVGMMKRLKLTLNRQTLQKLYLTITHPVLEYDCVLFDNCTQSESSALENVQLEAARVSVDAFWNGEKLLQEVGWATLSCHRQYYKLVLFYKIKHNVVPNYLHGSPVSDASEAPYNLRQPSRIYAQFLL